MPDVTYVTINDLGEADDAQLRDNNYVEVAVDDTSQYLPRKSKFSQLADYFLNKFAGLSLGGTERSVKSAIDAIFTTLATLARSSDIPLASTSTPLMDGTASVGSGTRWAKADHRHPTDTSRAASNHTHNYAASNHTHSNYSLTSHTHNYAAASHSHSNYAPLASPALTGNPTAPTQAAGNNSTRLATTAFVTRDFVKKSSFNYVYANASNNNTISTSGYYPGCLTNGQKRIIFFVPYNVIGGSPSVTSITNVSLRHGDGGYPYLRSGSNGGTYTQLYSDSDTNIIIWNNSKTVRTNEVSSVTISVKPRSGFVVAVNLGYQMCKASGNTTAVTNNVPISVYCVINIKLT